MKKRKPFIDSLGFETISREKDVQREIRTFERLIEKYQAYGASLPEAVYAMQATLNAAIENKRGRVEKKR